MTFETPKKICAMYGEGAVTEQMCLKWFVKFSAEDILDDAPWSSRPVDIDSYQIEIFSSVQFSRSVVSDSLQPHELQHARLPCPSPNPRVHSNSHPSSQ